MYVQTNRPSNGSSKGQRRPRKKMKMLAKGPDDTKGSRVGPLFSIPKKRDKTRKKREGVPSLLYFLPGQHFLLLPPSPSYFSVCPRGRQSQFLEQPPKERKTGRRQTWCVKTFSPPPPNSVFHQVHIPKYENAC